MIADPFELAVEHIAWMIRTGAEPRDLFDAFGEKPPRAKPTWNDAIWLAARVSDEMRRSAKMPALGKYTVHAPPPFRAPVRRAA